MGEFGGPPSQEGGSKGRGRPQRTCSASIRTDTRFEPPQGVSDDSSVEESGVRRSSKQTKSKEPKRFGDPVNHSIKEVSEELTGGALLKAALQEYRRRLTNFQERNDRPTESKLRLLEKHLFRRKFGWKKEWIGNLAGETTWRKTKEI